MRREHGYSMLELLIAMGITAGVTASLFGLMNPAQGAFSVQPEAADMQQRLRGVVDTLSKDLLMAGAGSYSGAQAGALNYFFAPVLPYRRGAIGDDPPGTFRASTLTLFYVSPTGAQTTIRDDLTSNSNTFALNTDASCALDPSGEVQASCGFAVNDTVLIYDGAGNFDTFTLNSVIAGGGTLTVNKPPGGQAAVFKAGSKIVKVIDRTYYLKADPARKLYQLASYDGGSNGDAPIADHVVGLSFDYFGDPQPPALRGSTCDSSAAAPCQTYGPEPPPQGVRTSAYPAGENCVFTVDPATGRQVPRLDVLGGDPNRVAPVLLTQAQLTDGPWCPDADSANRFDADLLRIRTVGVTLRFESANDALRGPASALFTRGGTATDTTRLLPDQVISFQITPRNLNLGR